jgi:hypothetical protein
VQCILEDSAAWKADYVQDVITMERHGNRIWFRQYHIWRDNEAVYEDLEKHIEEIARYVIIGNKSAAWRNEGKYGMNHEVEKFFDFERYESPDVYDGIYKFYCADLDGTVKGTVLQYAELSKYIGLEGSNPVKYCRYFVKYPVFEFLIKKGMYKVIADKINGFGNAGKHGIYWERKKLKECFKFPVRLINVLPPERWSMTLIEQCYGLYKAGFADSDIEIILDGEIPNDLAVVALKYMTVAKLRSYIESQAGIYRTYKDYLLECERLDLNMKSKSVLFPRNLWDAHLRTLDMVKYEESKRLDKDILKVYKKLSKKTFEDKGLIIRPAKNSKELIYEGQVLHHCVGGYAERVANGETAIFFIRKAEEPKKPYYTLEYQNGEVIQCRTISNLSYETEGSVKMFVERWLKKIRKGA